MMVADRESISPDPDLAILHGMASRMAASGPLPRVLTEVVDFATSVVRCDSCFIYVLECDELVLRASKNPHPEAVNRLKLKVGEGITGWVAQHQQAVSVAGNNAHSTQTRFKTWTSVAEQLPTFPFGHGPGYTGSSAYRFGSRVGATPRVVSDNYWVKQLWEMGILGALWYTAVLALAALAALRLFRAARPESGAVALAVCGLIAQQASASWFTNALDPSPYNLIFWLFVGLARMPSREDAAEAEVFGQV